MWVSVGRRAAFRTLPCSPSIIEQRSLPRTPSSPVLQKSPAPSCPRASAHALQSGQNSVIATGVFMDCPHCEEPGSWQVIVLPEPLFLHL